MKPDPKYSVDPAEILAIHRQLNDRDNPIARFLEEGVSDLDEITRLIRFIPDPNLQLLLKFAILKLRANDYSKSGRDSLTGLYNFQYMKTMLRTRLLTTKRRKNISQQLLFLDLDKFSEINYQYGHPIGSKVLAYAAALMKSCLYRPDDELCRYGGDEFVALLSHDDNELSSAQTIIDRINNTFMEHPYNDPTQEIVIPLSASCGYAPSITAADLEGKDIDSFLEEFINASNQVMVNIKRQKKADGYQPKS